MIRVVIPGKPHSQMRVKARRLGQHAQVYEPSESRNWKAYAQDYFSSAIHNPFDQPISVKIMAVYECPLSTHRKTKPRERVWHTKATGDADNIAKAVLDAGNGVAWLDDRCVCSLEVHKIIGAQGEAPRVVVHISPIENNYLECITSWLLENDDDNPKTEPSKKSPDGLVVRGEPWLLQSLEDS